MVCLAHLIDGTIHAQVAFLDPNRTLANAFNLLHGVRNKQHSYITALNKMLNTTLAFLLEEHVANRKRLINNKDIGLGNSSDSKGNTSNHTRREVLERHVDKVFKLGELDDVIEARVNKLLGITKQSAVKVDILACCKLGIKAGGAMLP